MGDVVQDALQVHVGWPVKLRLQHERSGAGGWCLGVGGVGTWCGLWGRELLLLIFGLVSLRFGKRLREALKVPKYIPPVTCLSLASRRTCKDTMVERTLHGSGWEATSKLHQEQQHAHTH